MIRPDSQHLDAWVQESLRGPGGNVFLAEKLRSTPSSYFGPLSLPLERLCRYGDLEPQLSKAVAPESFERRVQEVRRLLEAGHELPPMIVHFTQGAFHLAGRNDQHEALVREGRIEAPLVVYTTAEDDRRAFWEEFAPWLEIEHALDAGKDLGRQGVMGCLVVRPDGRIFAQKRSMTRKTFPGCWDLVGGHVEPGESPRQALTRELSEETGWNLDRVLGLRKVVDWESPGANGLPLRRREAVVAVTITGEWDSPTLESGKVTEGRWFGPEDVEILNENRVGSDTYVYDLVREELRGVNRPTPGISDKRRPQNGTPL